MRPRRPQRVRAGLSRLRGRRLRLRVHRGVHRAAPEGVRRAGAVGTVPAAGGGAIAGIRRLRSATLRGTPRTAGSRRCSGVIANGVNHGPAAVLRPGSLRHRCVVLHRPACKAARGRAAERVKHRRLRWVIPRPTRLQPIHGARRVAGSPGAGQSVAPRSGVPNAVAIAQQPAHAQLCRPERQRNPCETRARAVPPQSR
jgi:hypothetical protein